MREVQLIHKKIQELLLKIAISFLSTKKVAILQEDHTGTRDACVDERIIHSFPNKENKIVGLISLAMILHKITGVKQIHMNQLGKYKVREVMRIEFPIIHQIRKWKMC